jgi:hypothetical protein
VRCEVLCDAFLVGLFVGGVESVVSLWCPNVLVLLRDCFCVALQMLSVVHLMAIAAPDHSTWAVYFAAITVFKAQAAIIEVTASIVVAAALVALNRHINLFFW